MITLLTATGCRPEAWAICEKLMAAQTYTGPVRWIIVDDGEVPQEITFYRKGWTLEVIRPLQFWKPGDNTQARNLLFGLDAVDDSAQLVIIEDDDYYAPDWLRFVDAAFFMSDAELVGECSARYYNIDTQTARYLTNNSHASLCSTAMRGAAIDVFRQSCRPEVKFIDLELWSRCPSKLLFYEAQVIGIKGLPGRDGIGMGHSSLSGIADPSGEILAEWIGVDAQLYTKEAIHGVR